MRSEGRTGVHVILEYPATPDETRALTHAFAAAGIAALLRAAPRRRTVESSVWRVVIPVHLRELIAAIDAPRAAKAAALQALVSRISDAWDQEPVGHIEVGLRGEDNRRATGGVLLTPDLPAVAYDRLTRLADGTLDRERLFLWDPDAADWITFDAAVPVAAGSPPKRPGDPGGELPQGRFRRGD